MLQVLVNFEILATRLGSFKQFDLKLVFESSTVIYIKYQEKKFTNDLTRFVKKIKYLSIKYFVT